MYMGNAHDQFTCGQRHGAYTWCVAQHSMHAHTNCDPPATLRAHRMCGLTQLEVH